MSGQFIDNVKIYVSGGDGGAGCMSFRREAHVPKGGPDGGDGGYGGNVILVADSSKSSLIEFRYKHHFKASRGTHGKGSKKHGFNGEDVILKVPIGTVVKDENGAVINDLTDEGQELIVAQGGAGGRGNTHFVTPTRRAPEFAELGEPAEGKWIELEMKLMADVALVGMPSVGKSTLISRLSAARPKIADYPFTTITPNLGVAKSEDYSYVLADIPGLIEGASKGKGLGHEFLRHIERSALIVHIVDMTGSWDGRNPVEDYKIINNEIKNYSVELFNRPQIVVANKTEMPNTEDSCKKLEEFIYPKKLYKISSATGFGVDMLNKVIASEVKKLKNEQKHENKQEYEKVWSVPRRNYDDDFMVKKLNSNIFEVTGKKPTRAVVQTDFDNDEALVFLQHRLKRMGVESALANAGAKDGDEIQIAGRSFDFENTENIHDDYGDLS